LDSVFIQKKQKITRSGVEKMPRHKENEEGMVRVSVKI